MVLVGRKDGHYVDNSDVILMLANHGTAFAVTRTGQKHRTIASVNMCKRKDSPYSIAERRVPELIPVLGSRPAGDVSHKPGGRLLLLSTRPAVTLATLKRAVTNFAAW